MNIEPKRLNWDECDWHVARENVNFKIFHGENMTLQLAEVCKGHETSAHSHPYEQIVYIMQGECDFYVGGRPYPMSAGSLMSIPPNTEHYIIAKGDLPVLNLDIFYPKRNDRLESQANKEK